MPAATQRPLLTHRAILLVWFDFFSRQEALSAGVLLPQYTPQPVILNFAVCLRLHNSEKTLSLDPLPWLRTRTNFQAFLFTKSGNESPSTVLVRNSMDEKCLKGSLALPPSTQQQ